MVNTRLRIGSDENVGMFQDIPVSITYAIADVRDPSKRNSAFSKTVKIPGTKEVNILFENIFEVNIDLLTFNPNLKTSAYYYINDIEALRGDLQLLNIEWDELTKEIVYECSIIGKNGGLFLAIGDKYLTGNPNTADDLDFSGYNHTLNKTNVTNSWVATAGTGYYYGLIDYGFNGGNPSEYHVKHLRPSLYLREYLSKIFTDAGKTWTSTFLDSAFFKNLVIPATEETIRLSTTDILNNQFYAYRSSSYNLPSATLTYGLIGLAPTAWAYVGLVDCVKFNDDSTTPYNDAGNIYNTSTGVFTVANSGNYDLVGKADFDVTLNVPASTATWTATGVFLGVIEKWNGSGWNPFAYGNQYTVNASGTNVAVTISGAAVSAGFGNLALTAGDQYRFSIYAGTGINGFQVIYLDGGSNVISTGTSNFTCNVKTTSQYYANFTTQTITEGFTLEVNQCIPQNIKQIDLLTSVIKAFNLYVDVDKTNENNYIIEPREDFFYSGASNSENWTYKWDILKKMNILPMGDLDAKKYIYDYKADQDYYNQDYFNSYKEIYGHYHTQVENDFIKNDKKTEVIFSPTPVVGNNVNGLVIPKIYKADNGTIKNMKANIRLLYRGGNINLTYGSWTLKSVSGDSTYTYMPFVGMMDTPYAPTLTLDFGIPHQLYYSYPSNSYTNNNLFNKYWSRFLNQISDKNSKIVKLWVNLTEDDIYKFDFRKPVFIKDAYYYVNKIIDFNPLLKQSTQVELLKLTDFDAFEASVIDLGGQLGGGGLGNMQALRTLNSNVNNGTDSEILGGTNNTIAYGASGVRLMNCSNVVVTQDVSNFVGIGLSNVTIDSSNSGRFNAFNSLVVSSGTDGGLLPTSVTSATKTSSFTVDGSVAIYYINTSGGNITATVELASCTNKIITFKIIDATNSFIIDDDGAGTLDGQTLPYTTGLIQYESLTITSNGTNIFII